MEPQIVTCPACGSNPYASGELPAAWRWYTCSTCTLQFVFPMDLGADPRALYGAAYRGELNTSSMGDFAYRLQMRDSLVADPTLWFWTPAFQRVISWLKQNCGSSGTVLDVGCGPGLFLH